jgi:hypothetical protein
LIGRGREMLRNGFDAIEPFDAAGSYVAIDNRAEGIAVNFRKRGIVDGPGEEGFVGFGLGVRNRHDIVHHLTLPCQNTPLRRFSEVDIVHTCLKYVSHP